MIEAHPLHKQKLVFAWLPVKRWIIKDGFASTRGRYWLRYVVVVKAGILNEWTAYARYNDA